MGLESGSNLRCAAGEGTGEPSMDFRPGLEVEDCMLGSSVKACLLGLLCLLALLCLLGLLSLLALKLQRQSVA